MADDEDRAEYCCFWCVRSFPIWHERNAPLHPLVWSNDTKLELSRCTDNPITRVIRTEMAPVCRLGRRIPKISMKSCLHLSFCISVHDTLDSHVRFEAHQAIETSCGPNRECLETRVPWNTYDKEPTAIREAIESRHTRSREWACRGWSDWDMRYDPSSRRSIGWRPVKKTSRKDSRRLDSWC